MKSVLTGKFIVLSCYTKKSEKSKKNSNEPGGPRKTKANNTSKEQMKQYFKIRGKINEIETKTRISETRSWFFERLTRLANLQPIN